VQSTSLDAPLFHRGFVARRPQAVRDDIQFKFKHATSVSRWVQDSAANYVFGEFGSGLEIVRKEAIRLAAEGKTLSVLDAGCGSGGQLAEIAELMSKLSLPVYLRGVTAERSEVVPSLQAFAFELPLPSDTVTCSDNGGQIDFAKQCISTTIGTSINARIYQGFPLEDIAVTGAADFIRERKQFDVILCSWTLFHLCDPLGTLLQLRCILDPDGILVANGAYFHFEGDGLEAGTVAAIKQFSSAMPSSLCCEIIGQDVKWVSEDPSDEWSPGEFHGGHTINLCWKGGGCKACEVDEAMCNLVDYTGKTLDRVWQLESGQQYAIASYIFC